MLLTGLSRGGRGERFFAPPHNVTFPSGDDSSFGGGATCVALPHPHGVIPQYENTSLEWGTALVPSPGQGASGPDSRLYGSEGACAFRSGACRIEILLRRGSGCRFARPLAL